MVNCRNWGLRCDERPALSYVARGVPVRVHPGEVRGPECAVRRASRCLWEREVHATPETTTHCASEVRTRYRCEDPAGFMFLRKCLCGGDMTCREDIDPGNHAIGATCECGRTWAVRWESENGRYRIVAGRPRRWERMVHA